MNLQGRNLSARMHSEDVTLLQRALAKLRYQMAPAEQRTFFGSSTYQVVLSFQKAHRLAETGVAD